MLMLCENDCKSYKLDVFLLRRSRDRLCDEIKKVSEELGVGRVVS